MLNHNFTIINLFIHYPFILQNTLRLASSLAGCHIINESKKDVIIIIRLKADSYTFLHHRHFFPLFLPFISSLSDLFSFGRYHSGVSCGYCDGSLVSRETVMKVVVNRWLLCQSFFWKRCFEKGRNDIEVHLIVRWDATISFFWWDWDRIESKT